MAGDVGTLLRDLASLPGGMARTFTRTLSRSVDGLVGRWAHGLEEGREDGCCGGTPVTGDGPEPASPSPGRSRSDPPPDTAAPHADAGLGELELGEELMGEAEHFELELLRSVETYLRRGRDLKAWWDRASVEGAFAERFDLSRTFNEPRESYGFFDTAEVGGRPMPIMGNFQEMFYDRPKDPRRDLASSAVWMDEQVREFVLRYFMRVSDFCAPAGFADTWRPPLSTMFSTLSWCPSGNQELRGFGFRQLWYKERGPRGRVRRFRDEDAHRIVDLRDLEERYEWIVVKVRIFDFEFTAAPFGSGGPRISLPLDESSYLVLSADLVQHEERPEPGVLGRYGIGYAFIRSPRPGVLAYGPGSFEAAVELIRFHVLEDGTVRVPMIFVANRPERVVDLNLDPMDLMMDAGLRMMEMASLGAASGMVGAASRMLHALPRPRLRVDPVLGYVAFADMVSGGMAADYLCIDRQQLEKDFLVKHYMQHYQTIAGSLATWRLVEDWCDEEALPRWVRQGRRP